MVRRDITRSWHPAPFWGHAACVCLLIAAQSAMANPTGGTVTHGDASISNSGTTTTITQTSDKAIINWHDFSINANELTQFKQPSIHSFTLNRVTGGNVSQIMGQLKANGNIYLINPNGILFGKSAVVDVGGLVASTSPITDSEFLNDRLQHFSQSPRGGSIINHGTISVKNAGIAVLVAPTVINDGIINADLGVISIASADHFTLDLYGDNLINLDAGSVLSENGLVNNTGGIQANGGKITITAQAADKMLENVVNLDGVVQAESVNQHQGKIYLQGYDKSMMNIIGSVNLSGDLGGFMKVNADNINIAPTAVIHADALTNGNGGQISFKANDSISVQGTITARGGSQSGDGGFIETSAHNNVDFSNASISASAPHGNPGEWLIDPEIVNVNDLGASLISGVLDGGTNFTIWADDDITFSNTTIPLTWSASNARFSVRADFNQNGVGTILLDGACTPGVTCLVNTSSGTINYYYNPTGFEDFSSTSVSGTGVFNPFILINDATQLQAIGASQAALNGYYALNQDISTGLGAFTSLGGQGSGWFFKGHFTGALYQDDSDTLTQYKISNLTISAAGLDDVGLFGSVVFTSSALPGIVENVSVDTVNVIGSQNVGSIIGLSTTGVTLSNFYGDNVIVNGTSPVGGLIGEADTVTMTGVFQLLSTISSIVTSTGNDAGGIFGLASSIVSSATMSNAADITSGGTDAGGIAGILISSSDLSGALTNTGDISVATQDGGGIIGGLDDSSLSGVITVTGSTIGGTGIGIGNVIGTMTGGADLSSTSVTVTGTTLGGSGYVGGLVGAMIVNSQISGFGVGYSIPDVNVPTLDNVGGLIGFVGEGTTFSNTLFAINNVTGHDNVGGIIGFIGLFPTPNTISGTLSNSGFSVTGNSYVGGLIGLATRVTIDGTLTGSAIVSANGDFSGGLIGSLSGTGSAMGANAQLSTTGGSVSGVNSVGGLIGVLSPVTYSASNSNTFTNAASVIATGNSAGGIFGSEGMSGGTTINTNMSNTGDITGLSSTTGVGGIASTIDNLSMTGNLSNSGDISGADQVGGLFGLVTNGSLLFTGTLQTSTGTISGGNKVGGLFGEINNSSLTTSAIFNSGSVLGTGNRVGGIAGFITNASTIGANINMSVLAGTISGVNQVGGFVGQIDAGNNWFAGNDLTNNASVTGSASTGGIAGDANVDFTQNMTNNGTINGTTGTGGIFGVYTGTGNGTLINAADVTGTASVGGVVGTNNGTLSQAELISGTISGDSQVGGVIGTNNGALTQSLVYSGTISGSTTDVGGIAGYNTGTINDVSNAGTVSAGGATNVGGIIGRNDNILQYALSIGTVTGGTNVGALIGNNTATGNASNSFYDTNINAISAVGFDSGTSSNLIGATYTTLGTLSTYTANGFSAAIWQVLSGKYASLIWCGTNCTRSLFIPTPTPSPTPTISNNTIQNIQIQIVNNENSLVNSQPVLSNNVAILISYGSDLLGQLNFSADLSGAMASWFVSNSIILEIGDLFGPQVISDPVEVMGETVGALQEARGCTAP